MGEVIVASHQSIWQRCLPDMLPVVKAAAAKPHFVSDTGIFFGHWRLIRTPLPRKQKFNPKGFFQDDIAASVSVKSLAQVSFGLLSDAESRDMDVSVMKVEANPEAVSLQEQILCKPTPGHSDGFCEEPHSSKILVTSDIGSNALPEGLDSQSLPGHVAIIMDGNSRWAARRGLPSSIGHELGIRALKEVITMSCNWGIQALTVFAFSSENWLRPKMEISCLMNLFERVLDQELINLVKQDVCICVMGNLSMLPSSLQSLIARACDITRSNKGLKLTIALSYSGRQDIVQACQNVASQVASGTLQASDITEVVVERELGTGWLGDLRNPDLLIRTSGEQRLSNFMLWQIAYTELYFSNSMWPDFGEAQYVAAIRSFQQRDRRFGGRRKPPPL